MPIQSIKSGTLSRSTAVGNAIILPGDFESIATVTVGSGTTSAVEFTSIPQTFTHLQVRILWRSSVASENRVYLNGNGFVRRHQLYGTGSGVVAGQNANNSSIGGYYEVNSDIYSTTILDILDYTNTNKNKTTRALWGFDANGSGYLGLTSGLWESTSAITTIYIEPTAGTYQQYSHFALYGIRG